MSQITSGCAQQAECNPGYLFCAVVDDGIIARLPRVWLAGSAYVVVVVGLWVGDQFLLL
jgi:hypothetical protein